LAEADDHLISRGFLTDARYRQDRDQQAGDAEEDQAPQNALAMGDAPLMNPLLDRGRSRIGEAVGQKAIRENREMHGDVPGSIRRFATPFF
jgi:hypothetical protein